MLEILQGSAFKKDFKRLQKRSADMLRLRIIIEALASQQTLDERFRDHPLRGNYEGWRECHIAPDWLLIYSLSEKTLSLARTGSHADLFE